MDTYLTFKNLHKAYISCRRKKAKTLYQQRFSYYLEENLLQLVDQLQNRTYKPAQSIAFIVQKPKIREIFAADFRDRVVHHLLYNYLSPKFERIFIYDSWACRKGKGTHGAMLRLQDFASALNKDTIPTGGFYLQMDIKSIFTSIKKIWSFLSERKFCIKKTTKTHCCNKKFCTQNFSCRRI